MKKPILVVMAAGLGSRFGGLKQMEPFGPHGEGIIDYSIFDAIKAGFERVIFIINNKIKDDFKNLIGKNVESRIEVTYVYQELDNLPYGFVVPKERVKPWGTAHAILCCKEYIDAPFCVINGDDLYGRDAYVKIFDFLKTLEGKRGSYGMVGFELANTLSENGFVSRGQCEIDNNGYLTSLVERIHIISTVDGPLYTLDSKLYHVIPRETIVSMNLWGFTPDLLEHLEERFPLFYREAMAQNPNKAEHLLPNVVGELVKEGKVTVKVLSSKDKWYGVTNASDRPIVESAIKTLTESGVYPDGLWK